MYTLHMQTPPTSITWILRALAERLSNHHRTRNMGEERRMNEREKEKATGAGNNNVLYAATPSHCFKNIQSSQDA